MALSPRELGQRVKMERARRGQTQAQAAEAAGVGLRTWEAIEAGSARGHQGATLGRLARYLACDVASLMDGGSCDADDAAQADAPIVAGSSENARA
jgi:transcriptional regulator with XRE-family HTH domain